MLEETKAGSRRRLCVHEELMHERTERAVLLLDLSDITYQGIYPSAHHAS